MYLQDYKLGDGVLRSAGSGVRIIAIRPVASYDTERDTHPMDSEECINKCLNCPYERCVNCLASTKRKNAVPGRKGRPASVDLDKLRELLVLKTPKSEIMQSLGICDSTYYRYARLVKGGVVG